MAKKTDNNINNISVDIKELYDTFISQIDSSRSYTGIKDDPGLLSSLTPENINNIKEVKKEAFNISTSAQESRCHAFYRIIGLPVVANENSYYSPGFDLDAIKDTSKVEAKIKIIQNINKDLLKISIRRENYINQTVSEWFKTPSLSSDLIAWSSYNIRDFSSGFSKEIDPLDTEPNNQKYTIDDKDPQNISFSEYLKISDDAEQLSKFKSALSRYHFIKPIFVDPRIELSVQPAKNILCVPFADEDKTKLNDTTILKRPLIEKICRERLYVKKEKTTDTQTLQDVLSNVGNSPKDQETIKKAVSALNLSQDQQQIAIKYTSILNALINKLIDAQKTIKSTRAKYHWIPVPNSSGPEIGLSTRAIEYSNPDNLNTEADKAIVSAVARLTVQQLIFEITGKKETVASEQFNFSNFDLLIDDNSSGLSDKNEKITKKLIQQRNEQCDYANEALKNIEILTGEFSGLGLIDIICIYAGLYFISEQSLVGLMDLDAQNRMANVKELKSIENPSNVLVSLKELSKSIKAFYDLAQALYDNNSKKQ